MEKNVKAELLVVDDHSLILEGICKIVNKMPEVTVADAVTSGKQAIKLIEERDYDVYILDISIPDISGFELIAKIRELNDQAKIVVNTMHEEIWMVNRLVQCGVNAVILKSSAHAELVAAIRSVLTVSYTHLRAHETGRNLVCRLLLEKKKKKKRKQQKKKTKDISQDQ